MLTIGQAVLDSCGENMLRCILSKPVSKNQTYLKIIIKRLEQGYQIEKHTQTQVFHENCTPEKVAAWIVAAMETDFRQCNVWEDKREHQITVSSKGKVFLTRQAAAAAPPVALQHNRMKNYLFAEGTVIEPLVDMGIFTAEGKVVRPMYDKYKQINRFVELFDDEIKDYKPQRPLNIIDFGCGKSYLTFVLYYYFTVIKKISVNMVGLDLKEDVIRKCNAAAQKYGYQNLRFERGDINGYKHDGPVDMVITLHACDTATDYALYNAVKWNAEMIFSVPCCQHELNEQIQSEKLALLTRYGIVKERMAALMTDALRGNLLECCGYRAQLIEFVDMEHTPKNILIRAVKVPQTKAHRTKSLAEAEAAMTEFGLQPTLYNLLKQDQRI